MVLEISRVKFKYGGHSPHRSVFKDFNLRIKKGEFVALFGPNGSGKTTLLNLVAGVIKPSHGNIIYNNRPINEAKIAYVFQDYRSSLFPWLTAYENITFPFSVLNIPEKEKVARVKELRKMFRVKINLNAYPYELSGGQQQLVSIMRGLIINPDILLLDEPFSSLDYRTSLFLRQELEKVWLRSGVTTIFVSHDIDEAIYLSQRILVLGRSGMGIVRRCLNRLPYPRNLGLLSGKHAVNLRKKIMDTFSKGGENLN